MKRNEDHMKSKWFLFIANLPGRNQTLRMRVWRSLKASGAGTLRDGVYVLPVSDAAREVFERQKQEIQGGGGTECRMPRVRCSNDRSRRFKAAAGRPTSSNSPARWVARKATRSGRSLTARPSTRRSQRRCTRCGRSLRSLTRTSHVDA